MWRCLGKLFLGAQARDVFWDMRYDELDYFFIILIYFVGQTYKIYVFLFNYKECFFCLFLCYVCFSSPNSNKKVDDF